MRSTQTGVSVLTTNIAVEDGYGENKKTYFTNVVIWKHTAEYISKYAKKGDKLVVEGRLTIRDYEKDDGKRYVTEIVADKVELYSKNKSDAAEQENNISEMTYVDDIGGLGSEDDMPF